MAKVIDKIVGLFGGGLDDKSPDNPNTSEQQKIVDMIQQDFQTFRSARQPVETHWRQEQRFYQGDHWHGLRSEEVSRLRPDAVENIVFSQVESIVGKLAGWMPYPDFTPQEMGDEEKARDLNDFIPYELKQIKFQQKHLRAVRRMVIHGPLIYKVIFDPTVEGGRGLNRYQGRNDVIPVDFDTFYPDPRVRDFIDLQKMGAVIVRARKPIEYFRDRWEKQGEKVQPDRDEDGVFDQYTTNQSAFSYVDGSMSNDTVTSDQTSGLIEYWYRGLPKMISKEDKQLFREQAKEKLAQGIDPSEDIAKSGGKMEGIHCIYISTSGVYLEHKAYVYDHGQYPFVARTLYPDERNPWGKGFMRDMVKPQIFKNKYAEIAIETMAKAGNNAVVYEEGAITKPRTWQEQRSQSGAMLPVAQGRMDDWKELQGVNIPGSLFSVLDYYDLMLQKIPGQFDSANGQANPNVTSGEQAKALIAAASSRLNPVSDAVSDALAEVFGQYIELIAQFYTTARVARITGRRTVTISRDAIISRAPTEMMGQFSDPTMGEMAQTPVQLQEEYVPEFDIQVNIGVDKPHDREYWLQLAFNLLPMIDPITQLPMIDAEAVRYVVQNGRMEPMDVIKQRIEEAAGLQQQMSQLQQQNQQLQTDNAGMQQALGELTSQKSQQDQQKEQFNQQMQQQKFDLDTIKTMHQMSQPTGVR
ncbi:hypothetical protein WMW72_10650 [Paenibacillus filicis]|uniref:Portal protein n=1 Tax=Paenibacillus filicis TaxID=669464 RepID=A0ABU9DHL5_9BACL